MNFIINGFHHPKQIEIVGWIINHFDPKYVIHICDPKYTYNNSANCELVNLFYYNAGNGKYNLSECEPLDEELIERMAVYETTVLKMFDRLEYYEKRIYPYHERKMLYLKHLRYWNDLILKKKIEVYIGTNIPHEIYDYVILGLCKIHNIKTYYFLQSQINDIIHPMTDWEKNCEAIHFEYKRLIKMDHFDFDEFVENEWNQQTADVSPFYMRKKSFITQLRDLFNSNSKKYLHPYYYLYHFKKDLKRKLDNSRLKRSYRKVQKATDLNKKYFYVALHYQPEMTTCPIGGAYVDQFLMIEMLDKFLPPDINIYVKEHPKQEIPGRTFNYYKNILENKKRVFLMPLNTNTFNLIENSLAVVTVTGTVGWEALFREKPVLLFGHNYFQYAPGVFMIKTNEDCIRALANILDGTFKFNKRELKCFIQATYNCSIKGIIDPLYDVVSKIGIEESNVNIINWLRDNIKS